MATDPQDDSAPAAALAELRDRMRSLQLATVAADGTPHTGYTPFVFDPASEDGAFLVYVSQLSLHTRDLLATPRCGAMLIADESASKEIFARTRAHYVCRAEVIERDTPRFEAGLDALAARHGKLIGLLKTLPDFVLFRLVPESGQFVMGFGQAYRLTGDALDGFEHARTA